MAIQEARNVAAAREALLLAVGFSGGALAAVAIAMVGAVGRERGGEEATWLHLATLLGAMCAVVAAMALRGKAPGFPHPLKHAWVMGVAAVAFATIAIVSIQGIAWYYLASGLISVAIFLLLTWLIVRVSLAFYFASNTLGTVAGSLVLDEIGAFGAPEQGITLVRALGVVMVAAGVVLVRTAK